MAPDEEPFAADFIARRADGLARVYERYAVVLLATARHVLGRASEAEDCVHDALVRVWETPDSYRPARGSLRAFLIACVRNEAMSRLRGAARRTERERRVLRLEPSVEREAEIVDHVEAARVRAALSRLPTEQREVIEQAFFANRTQREIAEKLGIPLGTVKGRVALAMRKMQAELARERSA